MTKLPYLLLLLFWSASISAQDNVKKESTSERQISSAEILITDLQGNKIAEEKMGTAMSDFDKLSVGKYHVNVIYEGKNFHRIMEIM
jgi:hypothetical protein